MGKHHKSNNDFEFDSDSTQSIVNDIEYDLDDDEFFQQFKPRTKSSRTARRRDARRRIEEYWENRQLAERLGEYYD